ncbi:hypothetical protein L4D20_04340 [Vibrio kyushuensis]|uniref:hypothetical protein n=1 Tax=Vibrio kyushuensis TaxID=2910249 RepID=UPI003D0B2E82
MAILVFVSLIFVWGIIALVIEDFSILAIFTTIFAPIASVGFGVYSYLKSGEWEIIDVTYAACAISDNCLQLFSMSEYIGFDSINNWYLTTNVAWTVVLVPIFGNLLNFSVLERLVGSK